MAAEPDEPRTVTTVSDLGVKHLGKMLRIPDLHQPSADFDAPKVTVTAKLLGLTLAANDRMAFIKTRPAQVIDGPIWRDHPCYLTEEDS